MKTKLYVCLIFLFFFNFYSKGINYPAREKKDTTKYILLDEKGKTRKLSEFKGKVLYVDFWASWCGGCKKLAALSRELHAKFTKEQQDKMVFVNISVDTDTAAWRHGVKDFEVEGVNLISPGISEGAAANFRVTGLPRYITIDKKGKIAAFIAKTPQQPGIYEDLLELIDRKD